MFNCKNDPRNTSKLNINKKRYSISTKMSDKNTLLGKQT
jgi:hypothetical protein